MRNPTTAVGGSFNSNLHQDALMRNPTDGSRWTHRRKSVDRSFPA